ncbi:MAG: hypothetical protein AB7I68_10270 [Porticoccaceae bacterium]
METLLFVMQTLLLGIVCSLPAVAVGRLLAAKGLLMEMPKLVIGIVVIMLFALRIQFPQVSLARLVVLVAFLSPFLYTRAVEVSFRLGNWWWKKRQKTGAREKP